MTHTLRELEAWLKRMPSKSALKELRDQVKARRAAAEAEVANLTAEEQTLEALLPLAPETVDGEPHSTSPASPVAARPPAVQPGPEHAPGGTQKDQVLALVNRTPGVVTSKIVESELSIKQSRAAKVLSELFRAGKIGKGAVLGEYRRIPTPAAPSAE